MSISITRSQTVEDFVVDFENLHRNDFPEAEVNLLYEKYSHLLFWFNSASQLSAGMRGLELEVFPLASLKSESIYENSVLTLLQDTSFYKFGLGSFIVCATNDVEKSHFIKERIQKNEYDYAYAWSMAHHILLKPKDIDFVISFVDKNRNEQNLYSALEYYFRLDPNVLEEFGMQNLFNEDDVMRYLAIRSLAFNPLSLEKEALIRKAIDSFTLESKGWAIALAEKFGLNNMLTPLRPYLEMDTLALKDVSYRALAASSSLEDVQYLRTLILQEDSISSKYFPYLIQSQREGSVVAGMELLLQKPAESDLFFMFSNSSPIRELQLLPEIQKVLKKVVDPNILVKFIPLLSKHSDDKSTQLLMSFLKNEDKGVRQCAANSLVHNAADLYLQQLVPTALDSERPNLALVDNLIHLGVDTLSDFYERVYSSKSEVYWHWDRQQAFKYLSEYPLQKHKHLFREMLIEGDRDDFMAQRNSALALGRLHDVSSVDLIIDACEIERQNDDSNCSSYLEALAMIGGEKARSAIKSFENSSDVYIKKQVDDILRQW